MFEPPIDIRKSEIGNLPWALHNYWRLCRYAGDDERIRDGLFPLLRSSINLYLSGLTQDEDGRYNLAGTYNPEKGYGENCNYDMALLRWGCKTLVSEARRLEIDDPLMPKWLDVIENLAPYPEDEDGFRIALETPFAGGHRHYSHLLMIYPLYLVNWEQPENRKLIETSVEHWAGGRTAFAGYSYAGASSMYASIGQGDLAVTYLHELMDRQIMANTMYMEADSPVIESPLAAAESVHDMLLQSWNHWKELGDGVADFESTIRVFPGVSDAWGDVVFRDLRTDGAFLVSAARKDGRTEWVAVKSLAGTPCRIRPGLDGDIKALNNAQNDRIRSLGDGVYDLKIKKGETIVLYADDFKPDPVIKAVPGNEAEFNHFGYKQMDVRRR